MENEGTEQTNATKLSRNLKSGTLETIREYYKNKSVSFEHLRNVIENKTHIILDSTIVAVNKLEDKLKPFKYKDPTKTILLNKSIYQTTHEVELELIDESVVTKKKVKILPDVLQFKYKNNELVKVIFYNLKEIPFLLKDFLSTAKKQWLFAEQSLYHDVLSQIYKVPVETNWLVSSNLDNKIGIFKTQLEDLIIGREGANEVESYVYSTHLQKDIIKQNYISGYKNAISILNQCNYLGIKDFDLEYYETGGTYEKSSFK